LVTATPYAAGEKIITAADQGGANYYVTKLTAHRALLTQKTDGGSGYEFASGVTVPWKLTAAVANVSVQIDNA
jgi:hypothetical protein